MANIPEHLVWVPAVGGPWASLERHQKAKLVDVTPSPVRVPFLRDKFENKYQSSIVERLPGA